MVAAASYDRDFPHTLKVTVVAEVPIALLRRGRDAWVVSDSGRVLRKVTERPLPGLPRIWLPANADPLVGAVIGRRVGGDRPGSLGHERCSPAHPDPIGPARRS